MLLGLIKVFKLDMGGGMKKTGLLLLFSIILTTNNVLANQIVNGDFSLGNVGFSSNYEYIDVSTTTQMGEDYALWHVEKYTIVSDPFLAHGGVTMDFDDHTSGTGDGLMLMISEAYRPVMFWSQTLTITNDTYYDLSLWARQWAYDGTAWGGFDILINGVRLATVTPETFEVWKEFNYEWYSGNNQSATISFVNESDSWGNVAIDDIAFDTKPPSAVPEPSTLLLLGTGLASIVGMRRKRSK